MELLVLLPFFVEIAIAIVIALAIANAIAAVVAPVSTTLSCVITAIAATEIVFLVVISISSASARAARP